MNNLELWDKVAAVPKEAQKQISAGRLKGMTDINPVWRIKTLTEKFGMCGVGWIAPIKEKWLEQGADGVVVANVICTLKIKADGEWNEGIDGIGGSSFVAKESKGLFTSDEAFKMAYTDAISVACKMLGIGADVYWQAGQSKYSKAEPEARTKAEESTKAAVKDEAKANRPEYMSKLIHLMNRLISSESLTKQELQDKMNILSSEKKYTEFTQSECEVAIGFLTPFLRTEK